RRRGRPEKNTCSLGSLSVPSAVPTTRLAGRTIIAAPVKKNVGPAITASQFVKALWKRQRWQSYRITFSQTSMPNYLLKRSIGKSDELQRVTLLKPTMRLDICVGSNKSLNIWQLI